MTGCILGLRGEQMIKRELILTWRPRQRVFHYTVWRGSRRPDDAGQIFIPRDANESELLEFAADARRAVRLGEQCKLGPHAFVKWRGEWPLKIYRTHRKNPCTIVGVEPRKSEAHRDVLRAVCSGDWHVVPKGPMFYYARRGPMPDITCIALRGGKRYYVSGLNRRTV